MIALSPTAWPESCHAADERTLAAEAEAPPERAEAAAPGRRSPAPDAGDREAVMRRLARLAEGALGPAGCTIAWVLDDEAGRRRLLPASGWPAELLGEATAEGRGPSDGPLEAALAARERIVAADLAAEIRWPGFAARALARGVRACWVEPVADGAGTAFGAIAVLHPGPRPLRPADARVLEALAPLAAFAVRAAQGERELRSADARFADLAATIPGVVYQRRVTADGDIRYTYISEGARDLFGVSPEEILADPNALFGRHGPDYRANFRERLLSASRSLSMWDVEASIISRDGRQKYTHAIARPQRRPDGSVLWTGVILDATRIKEAERAATAAEARTREAIVESLSQGFLLYDANDRLITRNSHFAALYPSLGDLVAPGATYADVVAAELACGLDGEPAGTPAFAARLAARLDEHAQRHSIAERQLADDRWILVNEHRTEGGGTVVLYTDVSELKRRERRIQHMAHHDALTELPNRVLLRERLEEALARARRRGATVAALCLDLDHFKNINDTLGHPAGDFFLREIARRLRACVRDSDTVARLGGDEFAVVLADLDGPDPARALAGRMLEVVGEPVDYHGQQIVSGVSIGIAVSATDGDAADPLLKNADLALYRAKSDGRGTFRFFEHQMDAAAQGRRVLELDLRRALTLEEFEVHYQPLVDLFNDEILGFEALVRWRHPKRGLVPPSDFIPVAEETGVIVRLGEWVLERACADAAGWPEGIKVAVNLSPVQFKHRDLALSVAAALQRTGLAPSRLELEITESILIRDTEATLVTLGRLKDLGVRISMDDFGTGYSSLGNLRSFPFDKIKIDRSFVSDLERSPDAAAIVRAVLGLGRSLGMATTAEGVETRDQLSFLRAEGCGEVQGFFYSKAIPAPQVDRLLADGFERTFRRIRPTGGAARG